eukprot:3973489-Pyramimonas_sp.AAC.1
MVARAAPPPDVSLRVRLPDYAQGHTFGQMANWSAGSAGSATAPQATTTSLAWTHSLRPAKAERLPAPAGPLGEEGPRPAGEAPHRLEEEL